mmetsp:Transcript_11557/g.24294  ORF Transcript_11557/g.24294 Transcript_11557/m.24294 type:complete len:349 (-) Transcript_11557:332-1378(-)
MSLNSIVHCSVRSREHGHQHVRLIRMNRNHGQEKVVFHGRTGFSLLYRSKCLIDVTKSGIRAHIQCFLGDHFHALQTNLKCLHNNVSVISYCDTDSDKRSFGNSPGTLQLLLRCHDDLCCGQLKPLFAGGMSHNPAYFPEAEHVGQRLNGLFIWIIENDESFGCVGIGLLRRFVYCLHDDFMIFLLVFIFVGVFVQSRSPFRVGSFRFSLCFLLLPFQFLGIALLIDKPPIEITEPLLLKLKLPQKVLKFSCSRCFQMDSPFPNETGFLSLDFKIEFVIHGGKFLKRPRHFHIPEGKKAFAEAPIGGGGGGPVCVDEPNRTVLPDDSLGVRTGTSHRGHGLPDTASVR